MKRVVWDMHSVRRVVVACVGLVGLACTAESPLANLADAPKAIVGGKPTKGQVWTGVVSLIVRTAAGQYVAPCTGALIAPDVVVTAAHCVYMKDTQFSLGWNIALTPELMEVRSGANVGTEGNGGTFKSLVAQAVYHPTWTGDITTTVDLEGYDVGVLRLATPIEDLPYYCVREDASLTAGDTGYIVGYGVTNTGLFGESTMGIARYGLTTVRQVLKQKIEIGDPTNTCNGDSGGPFFTHVGARWEVTGVTSHGSSSCPPRKGGFDTNLITVRGWIEEQIVAMGGDPLGECTGTDAGGELATWDTGAAGTGEAQETDTGAADSATIAPVDTVSADGDTGTPADTHDEPTAAPDDTGSAPSSDATSEPLTTDSATTEPAEDSQNTSDKGGCRLTPRTVALSFFGLLAAAL